MPWTGEKLLERARRSWVSRRTVPGFLFAEEIPSSVTADECRKLAELAAGKVVLEVGSYFGRSTVAIASTASAVHSIDLHPPDDLGLGLSSTAAALVENLERYDLRHKVVLHIGFSQLILPALRRESFDLVFLDAQHEPDPVREDLQAVLPLVRRRNARLPRLRRVGGPAPQPLGHVRRDGGGRRVRGRARPSGRGDEDARRGPPSRRRLAGRPPTQRPPSHRETSGVPAHSRSRHSLIPL